MRGARPILCAIAFWGLSACASLRRYETTRDPLSPAEHVALGNAYLAQGEKAAAIPQYEAAVQQDRKQIGAWIALGNIAYVAHDWKKARTYFNRALKAAPESAAVINNLAMVDLAEGKHLTHARRSLEKALPTAGRLTPYLLDTLASIDLKVKHLQESPDKLSRIP